MNELGGWFSDESEWVSYADMDPARQRFATSIPDRTAMRRGCHGTFQGDVIFFAGSLIQIPCPRTKPRCTVPEMVDGNPDARTENKGMEHV